MKKFLSVIILILLGLIGFNSNIDIIFAEKNLENSHNFNTSLYKYYNFVSENDFYYINTETNKIERFNNGVITNFGEYGNTDGTFTEIKFFKKLKNGEFMVLDSLNRLQFFDKNFIHIKTLQHIKNESNYLLLGNISSITTDIYSNVYISDYSHNCILKANSSMNNLEILKNTPLTQNSKITVLNSTSEIVILDDNITKDNLMYSLDSTGHYIFSDALNYIFVILDNKIVKLNSNLELISELELNIGSEYNVNLENGKIFYIENSTLKIIESFASDISSYKPPVDINSDSLLTNAIKLYETNVLTALLSNPYANSEVSIILDTKEMVIVLGETTEFENNFYYVLYEKENISHLGYVEKKYLNHLELDTLNYKVTPVRSDIKYYKYPSFNINVLDNANLNIGQSYNVIRKIKYNNNFYLELKLENNYIYVLENETIDTSNNYINLYLAYNAKLKLYNDITQILVYDSATKENVIASLNKTTNVKIEETLQEVTKVSFIHDNKIITGFVETKFVVKESSFIIPLTISLVLIIFIILLVLILKYKKELTKRKN